MKSKLLKILFLVFGAALVFPQSLKAETNLEYFFGTRSTSKYNDVVIERVLSADTFILEGGEEIKLIGLRALEAPRKKKNPTKRNHLGLIIREKEDLTDSPETRALEFTRELLENKHVRLDFDIRQKNDSNQTLAYAFLIADDTFINAEILRNGFAYLQIKAPNKKYIKELRAAYKEAREEKRELQGQ